MHLIPRELTAAAEQRLGVSDWARGLWRRDLLEWDDGEDRTTRVIWIQTPVLFADIRIPVPGGPRAPEGFAGHLSVSGQVCRWNRPIDVKPKAGGGVDTGAMYRRGDRLVECGLQANYLEEWRLVGATQNFIAATRGQVSITDDSILWPADGPLEIAVGCAGHLIHAWRVDGDAGLDLRSFGTDGALATAGEQVGSAWHDDEVGGWSIWSTDLDDIVAGRLLEALDRT